MIQTKEFSISKGDLVKICLYQTFKSSKLLLFGIPLLALYTWWDFDRDPVSRFMFIFCILYPILLVVLAYRSVNSKQNKIFFKPRSMYFEEFKFLTTVGEQTVLEGQMKSEYPYDAIIKRDRFMDYWLLYISKHQAIPVPDSAFENRDDLKLFLEILKRRNIG